MEIAIGIGALILMVIFGLWQIRHSKKIAIDSGAFQKPKPVLSLLNCELKNEETYRIVFGCNFKKYENIFFEFPVQLANTGDKDLEGSHLIFKHAMESPLPLDDKCAKMYTQLINIGIRKFTKGNNGKFITYFIKQVNPKVGIMIQELLLIPETVRRMEVPATTKDNVNILAKFDVSFMFIFELLFTAQNCAPQKFKFDVEAINSKDIDELINKQINSLKESAKKNSEEIDSLTNTGIIFSYPDCKLIDGKNKIYQAKTNYKKISKLEIGRLIR
ncbi:MAG: hypothetical protein ACUZ77_04435 [Candidatus Brocadiales bacterium]